MNSKHYTKGFYEQLQKGAKRSAEIMAPLTLQLVPAHSVVDVGCGIGSWLAVFQQLGVADILGIDGDYVDRDLLQIPKESFRAHDLTKPFHVDRMFDLAISLEVAEHLPVECASTFVECLTHLAPFILFSAAIPFQGGTDHLNEQWPDQWAGLFRKHGYLPIDFIRKKVWENKEVEWWYAQNTFLFAKADLIENDRALKAEFEQTNPNQLCLVHPKLFLKAQTSHPSLVLGVRALTRRLLTSMRCAFRTRLNSMKWR